MGHCLSRFRSSFGRAQSGALPKAIDYWLPTRFHLPGMTRDDSQQAIETVFRLAQLYVPIPFNRVSTASRAMIRVSLGAAADFDRTGDTLAMADVVNLRDHQPRDIWFSPFVQWSDGPVTDVLVNPIPVGAHELGHTLGFGHGLGGLMSPIIDPLVTTPTEREMQEFWAEYPEWSSNSP